MNATFFRALLKAQVLLFTGILMVACSSGGDKSGKRTQTKGPEVEIQHYGKALFALDTSRLQEELLVLQPRFRFFLDADLTDPYNLKQMQDFILDPFLRDVAKSVDEVYPEFQQLEKGFSNLFAQYQIYFPEKKIPQVYTYISGLHYEAPVNLADSIMLIAIDLFLGEDASFYKRIGMPRFVAQRCTPDHVLPLSAAVLVSSATPSKMKEDDLISLMLTQGRLLYLASLLLPGTPDNLVVGFSPEQYAWCLQNEEKVWAFLVNKDLLFSQDPMVVGKFMRDGPFTISFPEESPARLGWWVGWRIVQAYMKKNPETSPASLLEITDGHAFLQASAYRPR